MPDHQPATGLPAAPPGRTAATELHLPEQPLTDGVVVLRRWTDDDVAAVREASRDRSICRISTLPADCDHAGALRWVGRQHSRLAEGVGYPFAIAETAQPAIALGFVGAWLRGRHSVELGYWLLASARGRGLAHRAVDVACEWATSALRAQVIELCIEPGNTRSERVARAAGFRSARLLPSYKQRSDGSLFDVVRWVRPAG